MKVTSQAKALAPVDLGELRGSIMWKSYKAKGGHQAGMPLVSRPKKNEIIVGSNTAYAVYQEFGTRKMYAQPYLRPAVDMVTNGTAYTSSMVKAMRDSVKRAL